MADVEQLGAEGEVVRVADGYARNFLLPQNLAAPVTEATRRRLARMQEEREEARRRELEAARELAGKIGELSCTIPSRAGSDEKLYGSVTEADVVAALAEQGVEVDRQAVEMEAHIKELGIFGIPIRLHPEVEATLKVWVVEE